MLVLAEFGFNLSSLLGAAAENTGKGEAFLQPGLKYGVSTTSKIDFVSPRHWPWCSARPACRTS